MNAPPKKTSGPSGQHPAVKAFRHKLESIADGAGEELEKLRERIEKLKAKSESPPPPKDPRREGDDEIPVDTVQLESEPPSSDV